MAKTFFILIYTFVSIIKFSNQLESPVFVSFSKLPWTVSNSNGSIKVPTRIPGGIYTDLQKANILREDIFYRYNDIKYRWVGKENWTYNTGFTVGNDVWENQYIWLVFHGLDTVANIFLNDVLIGKTENMFVRYRYNIKSLLKKGNNELRIYFLSPIFAALNRSTSYQSEFDYNVPPKCTPREQQGECHVNFLRKMAASFSWDWGPAFPSVGIWKNIEIEAFDSVVIRSTSINVVKLTNKWEVTGSIYFDSSPNLHLSGTARISIYNLGGLKRINIPDDFHFNITTDRNGEASLNFSNVFVNESLVELWWPNGYGGQPLYLFKVVLNVDNEVSSSITKFGFRTVDLVQEPIDRLSPNKGLTFFFKVNGVKVYAKGSNFIPAHILPELTDKRDVLVNLLTATRDVHMNMLRVWGGGLYESDLFYQLCDEMGIMVWQDMMFACNMYPTSEEFLQSVSTEVVQNVRRLHSHPSIVVWAGNNENEVALRGNWYGTQLKFQQYKDDYVKLYVNVIKKLVNENDKTREYVVSSPSNGIESEREGYIARNPYSPLYGDVHVYQYFADNWYHVNVESNRFCSEYGIQSLPSYTTLLNVARPEDMNVSSQFMNLRQHHGAGYFQIQFEIDMNLPRLNPDNFQQYIYFSQINQAMSIKTMTEKYRSLRDFILPDGNGLNMGALYWQLNDVWQAPSWSSIDFGGKWKMLHYFAKSFFSPILIIPSIELDNITVMITSDVPTGVAPLECTFKTFVYRWDSFEPVKNLTIKTELLPFSSVVVINDVSLYDIVGDETGLNGCGYGWEIKRKCFFTFRLYDSNETKITADAFLFPERLKLITGLKKAAVELKEIKKLNVDAGDPFLSRNSTHYEITIVSNSIALFVWLDVGNIKGQFSDNGFHMILPEWKVSFICSENVTLKQLSEALNIMTLNGYYKASLKGKSRAVMSSEARSRLSKVNMLLFIMFYLFLWFYFIQ